MGRAVVRAVGNGHGLCLLRDLRAQRRFQRRMGPLTSRTDGSWQASGDPGLPALVGLAAAHRGGPGLRSAVQRTGAGLILQHERSHRRNGDHWANGALLARAVFWFHPLLPWAARRFLRDQELACDACTIARSPLRGLYASTLLKAQLVHPVAPAVCHWRSQPVLKERIAMLKQSAEGIAVGVRSGAGGRVVRGNGSGGVGQPGQCGRKPKDRCRAVRARGSGCGQGGAGPSDPGRQDATAVLSEIRVRAAPGRRGEPARGGGCAGRPSDVRVLSATNPGVFDACRSLRHAAGPIGRR